MKSISFFLILITIGLFTYAQPINQQSTTGKIPPKDIDLTGHIFNDSNVKLQNTITGVPSYLWNDGCGPTALAMVIGYYDTHGFPDLIIGSGATQTATVDSAISTNGNYNDYCLPLDYYPTLLSDKSELPAGDEHIDNCIADFMETSQSNVGNYYGWSWSSGIIPAFNNYCSMVSTYQTSGITYSFYSFSWNDLVSEIDNSFPLVFLVDTDGDGSTDHFITVIGYKSETGINYYGCYDTWDHVIHWYEFRTISLGNAWGVSVCFTFRVSMAAGFQISSNESPHLHCFPNPFDESVRIDCDQIVSKNTTLEIYSISGELINSLTIQNQKDLFKGFTWNGCNASGKTVPPGFYYLRMISGETVFQTKLIKQ
jgi:hypothetical protein